MSIATYLIWLVAGLALVVAELLSGTFHLLLLGVAALIASAAAYMGAPLWAQVLVAAIAAVAGILGVQRHKRTAAVPPAAPHDVGQTVAFEAWQRETGQLARVRYRDSQWDARVEGKILGEPGEMLHIVGVDGNTLVVAKTRRV